MDRKKANKQDKKFWEMKMSADNNKSADIFIYGEITKYAWDELGEHSATTFKQELDDLGDVETINLYVNSPGGSVFEGVTIHNMLKRHDAKVIAHVDALAASIASVIIMAADEIRMPSNSMLMIHNPWTFAIGNSAELRKQADDLDRIGKSSMQSYLDKAGEKLSEEKLQELLDAESWLSAEKAFEYGLCDVVEEANDMAASISKEFLQRYKNVPKQLQLVVDDSKNKISQKEMKLRQKIADEAKAQSEITKSILGGIYS
ncbi:Clp protease ClpP [Virgibacillus sp. AGTR]|uniref:head maturation protease, ClpP-related n=1 Tax=Virgibacillus sp. AGTR TaxID=2812055 RepID=UPI001D162718|nr:head maturation protease, ClpP-related [Virgibacillus sp. AGTR]MCC2249084.1 Clp protease ClpP [Virgibacillus sp. AGTR]